jgi:hypothetical protein
MYIYMCVCVCVYIYIYDMYAHSRTNMNTDPQAAARLAGRKSDHDTAQERGQEHLQERSGALCVMMHTRKDAWACACSCI